MEPLNIVQVTHAFPPYMGGLSHVVKCLSLNLIELGHKVKVVTLDPNHRGLRSENYEGVEIRRFSSFAPSNAYFLPSPAALNYLRKVEADIVHAHNIGSLFVPACWFALRGRLNDIGFVISPHHHFEGSLWHTQMLRKPYIPVARYVIKSADEIHCVSRFEADLVREAFFREPVVIQNGISEDVLDFRWEPPDDEMILMYAGRLEKYKRVNVLVEAASIVSREVPNVTLRIIGNGSDLSNILSLAAKLNVKIEHYDFLPRADYLSLMSTSNYFVNLSEYEAFSIVVAEAISIGLNVVAALPWGITFESFNNVRLVNGGSAVQTARSILDLKNKKMKLNSHGKILFWSQVAQQMVEEIYLPLLASKRNG